MIILKTIYLDCFSGFSGNMLIGAFLDAGMPFQYLKAELAKLQLTHYNFQVERVFKCGIRATLFSVHVEPCHQRARNLSDVIAILESGQLSSWVEERAKKVFTLLAEAEATVHGTTVGKVHFHEVGSVEAIINIVGALIGCEYMGIARVRASALHVGSGFVMCSHGRLPIPAPATAEILKRIPFYATDIQGELVTPTGAALVTALSESFGPLGSQFRVESIAYGAGSMDISVAHVLRLYLGEEQQEGGSDDHCSVKIVETNMDDMNPQHCSYVMELLLENGAMDVFFTPVFMKKNRPGVKITVAVSQKNLDTVVDLIFRETSTVGLKIFPCETRHLEWEMIAVETEWGPVRVKLAKRDGQIRNTAPEYEDCRNIADQFGVPLKFVYQKVMSRVER